MKYHKNVKIEKLKQRKKEKDRKRGRKKTKVVDSLCVAHKIYLKFIKKLQKKTIISPVYT